MQWFPETRKNPKILFWNISADCDSCAISRELYRLVFIFFRGKFVNGLMPRIMSDVYPTKLSLFIISITKCSERLLNGSRVSDNHRLFRVSLFLYPSVHHNLRANCLRAHATHLHAPPRYIPSDCFSKTPFSSIRYVTSYSTSIISTIFYVYCLWENCIFPMKFFEPMKNYLLMDLKKWVFIKIDITLNS